MAGWPADDNLDHPSVADLIEANLAGRRVSAVQK
jgi:hypothetical protein